MKKDGCVEVVLCCASCKSEFTKYVRLFDIPNLVLLKTCKECGGTNSKLIDYWYKNSITGRKRVKIERYTRGEWSDGGQRMVYGNVSVHLGYGAEGKTLFYTDPLGWIGYLK